MENLGIDPKLIIAQIVSFVIFYFIFQKFVSRPLLKYLKKQKEEEELREKLAVELESRKQQLDEKDRKLDRDRKGAFDKAVVEAKKNATEIKQGLVAQAKTEAEKIVAHGRNQIEDERKMLYKDARKKSAQLAIMLLESSLKEYLTPEAKKQVTKNIMTKAQNISFRDIN